MASARSTQRWDSLMVNRATRPTLKKGMGLPGKPAAIPRPLDPARRLRSQRVSRPTPPNSSPNCQFNRLPPRRHELNPVLSIKRQAQANQEKGILAHMICFKESMN